MTQKAIGQSFEQELVAYQNESKVAILGTHFTWDNSGGLFFFSDTPEAVMTAVKAVYALHDPATIPLSTQAQTLLAAGLHVASTIAPAINGIYAVDTLSQADIVAIETSLNAGRGFPGGGTTFNYPDASGAIHSFSETDFTNFAAAVRDFVYGCKSVIAGASSILPDSSVTIA